MVVTDGTKKKGIITSLGFLKGINSHNVQVSSSPCTLKIQQFYCKNSQGKRKELINIIYKLLSQ